ncbi:unnamed protein product [Paramecium octaurelia]|uniref:Uncharacterized protein n=1 Tax=Paramecium octaurelia TaxID=43137 RepID=A0A8S1WIW7_PAROT|nr:unnamed protein product [Paramecium octaurelia]
MGRILVLHRKKSQKMILIQRFISWHIRWQSSYSELDFSKQVSKFKNILEYFNFCLDRFTNPDYAFINLKSESYVRDFYTLQWKKVENTPSNKACFLKLRKLSLKFKLINSQIYLQQHSMMKLVQNQKLQCNF